MKPLTKETEKLFKPLTIAKQDRLEIALDNSADAGKFVFEFYSLHMDVVSKQVHRRAPMSNDTWRFIDRLPEATRIVGGGTRYLVGATDFSALLVHSLWPRDQLNIKGQDALTMYKYLLVTSITQEKNIERIANFKLDKTAHGFHEDWLDCKEHPLTPYQKLAATCAMQSEAFALHMQQGCLAGDSELQCNRAGKSFRITIVELHHKFNGGGTESGCYKSIRYWNKSIPTTIRCLRSDGTVGLAKIGWTKSAGVQKTIQLTLSSGQKLTCTLDHEIVTPNGKIAAGDLQIGYEVLTAPKYANKPKVYVGPRNQALVSKIVAITVGEPQEVFDVNVCDDAHTYIANGVVVGNTGKTPVAINVMCNLARKFRQVNTRMFRALIVMPKNVRSNWVDEIEKFKTVDGKVTVLRGTVIDRTRALLDAMRATNGEKFTAVIVSYETMARMLEAFRLIEWDLCIMDEMHNIASYAAKRTKASMILRDLCHRRLGLTGTPVRNHALDLYSQLEFLGKGFSGFSSWKTFKNFYGSFEKTDYGERLIGIQNLPMIRERLARLSYNITKEEALPDLPDKVYDIVEVEMTAKQSQAYKELSNTLMLEIETKLAASDGPNRQLVVQNILVQLLRLAQITSGFCVFDEIRDDETGDLIEPKLIEFFDPNPKLDMLLKLMKGDEEDGWEAKGPNDKTIVWACWTADIKAIYNYLTVSSIKCVSYYGGMSDDNRDAAVKAFNEDPTVKVFIGNAAAGGVGLNLLGYPPGFPDAQSTNANHVVYYSQNWSQVQRSQSEDRAHRRGTREPVRVTDLCVANSIDEEIRARVVAKKKMALEISDVRSIMRAVLTGVIDDE